jgi:BRCA1-associated RING domain protein 1
MGDFLPGYRVDLQALVMAGGGLILHRKPVILVDDLQQKQTIIVYNNEACIGINKDEISKLLSKRLVEAKELGMLVKNSHVVPHHWILDSVACSEMHAFPLK